MAKVLSSISGNLISAASAGFAPTNGADVSAIASSYTAGLATTAYVDSAVSGVEISFDSSITTASSTAGVTAGVNTGILSEKLDASASSDFYSTSNPSGFITGVDLSDYATTSYVDSAVSGVEISFDSSIATASSTAGVTASVNTAILSAYAYESSNSAKLDATAFSTVSGNFLTSQTVTALGDDGMYITSINGSALSGQGGGGTQVVTSTGSAAVDTGGGYQTAISGINGSAIIALSARDAYTADNATYATEATYARFDERGRELTSIGGGVDSATVSAIASAYQVVSATAGDGGYITSINGSGLSGAGGGGGTEMSANTNFGERWISYTLYGSSYYSADINTSRKSMKLYKGYDPATIALWLSGGPWIESSLGYFVTSVSIPDESAAMLTQIRSNASFTATSNVDGAQVQPISAISVYGPSANISDGVLQLKEVYVNTNSYYVGGLTGDGSPGAPYGYPGMLYDQSGRASLDILSHTLYYGNIYSGSTANFTGDVSASGVSVTGLSAAVSSKQNALTFGYDGTAISSIDGSALAGGGGGAASLPLTGSAGYDSATYDATGIEFVRNDTAGEPDKRTASYTPDYAWIRYTVDDVDYYEMILNETGLVFGDPTGDHFVDAYSIDLWNSAVDTVSSNSATWGQGGVDSATVSAIASSYAESAVSSVSGNYYSTSNPSSFVPASAISAESAVWNSASAISSYALSADVSGTVDLVSTQSANWGGSALALSAGPGVKLELSGSTLVASTDETVLWSGSEWVSASPTISLSGSVSSYERIGIYAGGYADTNQQDFKMLHLSAEDSSNGAALNIQGMASDYTLVRFNVGLVFPSANGSALRFVGFRQFNVGTTVYTANSPSKVRKIVGVNRTAGV